MLAFISETATFQLPATNTWVFAIGRRTRIGWGGLLELSEELRGSALGCAVSKVENCGYVRGKEGRGNAGEWED